MKKLHPLILLLFFSLIHFTIAAQNFRKETAWFIAEVKPGTYKAGTKGFIEISVVAKDGCYIDMSHPFKFETSTPAPAGVVYPNPILEKKDWLIESKKAVVKIPFVKSKAGHFVFSGVVSAYVFRFTNHIADDFLVTQPVNVK